MAYYGGESLSSFSTRKPLNTIEVFQIGFSIAQGLWYAHQHGVVHRDIKPENIMITPEGTIKIVDFGLAKLAGSSRLTRTDTAVGTARFMSPEQAMGKSVDHRTDIWSLGVIMYELATGQPPFTAEFDAAVIYSILQEQLPPAHEGTMAMMTHTSTERTRRARGYELLPILKDISGAGESQRGERMAGSNSLTGINLAFRIRNDYVMITLTKGVYQACPSPQG